MVLILTITTLIETSNDPSHVLSSVIEALTTYPYEKVP